MKQKINDYCVSIVVPSALVEKVKKEAEKNYLSMAGMIRTILVDYFKNKE